MSLAFIFPTLSWAFEVRSEAEQGTARIETTAGVDPALARQFSVPTRFGRIVEATPAQGGPTLLLVQDLHCNVEVQNNIRGILLNWQSRHPQLGLVAVEGASGIIPTLELLSLPETPAKRAVLNYFLREGKLTGADVLAVTARPDWELFGAEDPALYDRSLDLIAKFATDENRGLVFELMDQVRFLRSRKYNPDLLAFEQRRDAVLRGRLGSDEYHRALLQEARWRRLPLAPPPTPQSGSTDFQDQVAQDQYLESVIREALFRTSQERALFGSQRFVELTEQLLTVSLSQAEVEEFRARRRTTSLSGIQKDVQAELRKLEYAAGLDTRFGSDIAALEPMLDQGLEFYRLAEQRNTALFERTVARARERNDRVVALVSGGFHAQAIGALARRQGLGCVCVRPAQNRTDPANNYFQLLRNPDQPTELEKLVDQRVLGGTAIAVRNFLLTHVPVVRQAVDLAQSGLDVLQGRAEEMKGRIVQVDENTVRINVLGPRGRVFLNYEGEELRFVNRRPVQPGIRALGFVLLSGGIAAAALAVSITAAVSALVPTMLVVGTLGLIGVGIWSFSSPRSFASVALTRRNVIFFAQFLGVILFPVVGLATLGDHFLRAAGQRVPRFSHLQAMNGAVGTAVAALDLPAVPQRSPAEIPRYLFRLLTWLEALAGSQSVMGIVFMSSMIPLVTARSNTPRLFGLVAEAQQGAQDAQFGIPYAEGEARPAAGYRQIFSFDDENGLRNLLRKLGFTNLADLLKFEVYKEKPEHVRLVYAPIRSHVIKIKLWLLRQTVNMAEGKIAEARRTGMSEEELQRTELWAEYEYLNFVLKHLNTQAEGTNNYHLPRILVTDMQDQDLGMRFVESVHDLNPAELLQAQAAQLPIPRLLEEIAGDDELRAEVQEAMDIAVRAPFARPAHTWDNATLYTRHGAVHEVAHFLAGYATPEMEDVLVDFFLGMTDNPLYYKNMIKALAGIRRFRAERGLSPSEETTRSMLMVFANEMFCDLMAVYLMERAGETHMYTGVYGIQFPAALRPIFDRFVNQLVELDRKQILLLFTEKAEANSAFIRAQMTMSSLSTRSLTPAESETTPAIASAPEAQALSTAIGVETVSRVAASALTDAQDLRPEVGMGDLALTSLTRRERRVRTISGPRQEAETSALQSYRDAGNLSTAFEQEALLQRFDDTSDSAKAGAGLSSGLEMMPASAPFESSAMSTASTPQATAPAAVRGSVPVFLSTATQGATADALAALNSVYGYWSRSEVPAPPPYLLYSNNPAWQTGLDPALKLAFLEQHSDDPEAQAFLDGLTPMPLTDSGPNSYEGVQASGRNGVVLLTRPAETFVPYGERLAGADPGVNADRAADLVNRLLDRYAQTPGPIGLQISDPGLQAALQAYLETAKGSDRQIAALAQALTINGPAQGAQQVAVYTPQNPVLLEVSVNGSGALNVLVGQPFIAIPRSVEVSGEAARQSAANLSQVSNAAAFAGFYLLTAEQASALALQNFQAGAAWAVTGMVDLANARLAADQQSAIRVLAQRLLQVLPDLGATPNQSTTLWYDAAQAAQKQAALAQGRAFDLEITYGAESADVSSKVLSLLAGALAEETPLEGRVTGAGVLALGTLLETPTQADRLSETALAAAERAAAAAWRTSLATDTDLQEALWDLTGSREPDPATLAVLRDTLRDRVSGQSAVVVVSRAAGHAEPTHTLRTEVAEVLRAYVGPSRTKGPDFVDPYGATEVQPEDYPGLEVQVTGEFKTFSRVALALAGMRLVGRALTGYAGSLLRGLRNPRDLIPNFRFVLPTFLKALRIMLDIVLGRFGVQRVTDPYLRQQIRLLLELEKAHGTDLARVPAGRVPETLAPVMPQLLRLRQFLNNPLFGAMFRALGVNIDDLNVYLLLLLDRYQTMDQLRWYLTPGSYLRSAVQDTRTDLSPGVRRALVGSARFQRTLTRLDQRASPRLVRSVLWQIVALLNAKDLSEADRKALQVSVLRLLSRIDPARQTGIQARLDDGTLVQVQLPLVLLNTPQLLRGFYPHFDLYYQNGKRVPEPVQNMVVSTLQAA